MTGISLITVVLNLIAVMHCRLTVITSVNGALYAHNSGSCSSSSSDSNGGSIGQHRGALAMLHCCFTGRWRLSHSAVAVVHEVNQHVLCARCVQTDMLALTLFALCVSDR
jgi:hypothetical protein